jgi:NTP pyrophosphatase (non-canonical NTP hydrolase)
MNMQEKIKIIADNYGYEAQARQLTEEMAELIVALNKQWRGKRGYMPYDGVVARQMVIEEIADVEIVLEQIKHLLDCDGELFMEKMKKVDRTIERMKANEKA